jgi:uncharacterized phiE125 gp8 family phage protein
MTLYAQKPTRTAAPAETPVTLAEVKSHLRVEVTDDDALISLYLNAAISQLDGWGGVLGRCMVTQTWQFNLDAFPAGDLLRLPFQDVSGVVVKYYDAAGSDQTLSASLYRVANDALSGVVMLDDSAAWPTTDPRPDAVRIAVTAGYGLATAVPASLKAAILLMVGDLYRFRESASIGAPSAAIPMSTTVKALIAPYRLT